MSGWEIVSASDASDASAANGASAWREWSCDTDGASGAMMAKLGAVVSC